MCRPARFLTARWEGRADKRSAVVYALTRLLLSCVPHLGERSLRQPVALGSGEFAGPRR